MLSIRHLSVTPTHQENGLTDISLEAGKGEVIGLIGANGSGKSLLLRTIADPDTHFEGDIVVNHFHSRREPGKVKAQTGYVSQNVRLEPYLTGFEYLELLGAFYHLSSSVRVNRILTLGRRFNCLGELYGLLERQGPALHQKVQLIGSLIAEPAVLLWDEPTQFLDQAGREAAASELEAAVKAGAVALLATNDLVLAETMADRLVVLSHGQIMTEGTLTQLQHLSGEHKKNLPMILSHLLSHEHA